MRSDFVEGGLWGDWFSVEERKGGIRNVETGVRRKLWGEEEEEEDDDDDEGEGEGDGDEVMGEDGAVESKGAEGKVKVKDVPKPMPLETLLRFATGSLQLPTRAMTSVSNVAIATRAP